MIQIQEPQLEALIMERLRAGSFDNVEQTLMDALTRAPSPAAKLPAILGPTSAQIFEALQKCPVEDFNFEPETLQAPISNPVRF